MYIIALDTSTPTTVIGVVTITVDAGGDCGAGLESQSTARFFSVAERILPDCRQHGERLTPSILECLDEAGVKPADLDAVVVGCGPGPFTGLRVGMATATAFGEALGIPVHGVCSLDSIAIQLAEKNPGQPRLLVATDARRREVYWASYECTDTGGVPVRVGGQAVNKPADVVQLAGVVGSLSVPGGLAEKLRVGTLAEVPAFDLSPSPVSLVRAADLTREPEPIVPLYLRRPDAVPPKPKPISPAVPDVEL
ncbi:tRNA (adenosine(37)-N6)-threonylcarbamoyltransferase complex dimerization subunit type 1 TsaB [Corynebacterium sp. CCM 9204]|uniref:tRNA (adenosine(37)-N6)-threonylcarbamoyltransferase complex dimerization subunit type 1 TsaB n=1 Tax=Corynebacterium sp. CCM 9204 TaxID=3057616 RepID=UPI00352504F8